MVIQRSANRFLKIFGTAFAVKDQWGNVAKRFNSLAAARMWASRASARHDGITFSIWSGKGFTVSLGIRYKGRPGGGYDRSNPGRRRFVG